MGSSLISTTASTAGLHAILATDERSRPPWLPAASHRTDQGGTQRLRHRLLVLVEAWRIDHNSARLHSAHGWRTPAEFAAKWINDNQLQLA